MADHPLRPATRRRLGEPLPHQQADRPRVHPCPPELSNINHAIKVKYSVLATVSRSYPKVKGRLLTCYSPETVANTEYDPLLHGWGWKAPAVGDVLAAYQLVGEVMAHQGFDG